MNRPAFYKKAWKWLSKQVVRDAGNRCELCCAPNGESIIRDKDNGYPWELTENKSLDELKQRKVTKVIIGIHFIDGDRENFSSHNIIALCQKCRLRLDRDRNIKRSKSTRLITDQNPFS